MKNRKKCTKLKPIMAGAIFLAIVILVVSCVYALYSKEKSGPAVMRVDGEPVSQEEFKLFEDGNLANTVNYFQLKYNAEYIGDFWNKSVGGEVPGDMLRKKTVDQLVHVKIEQRLAKDNGVIADITYGSFLESLKNENKRREKAVKNKQVIYGSVKFNEREYYDYLLSNNVIKLKEILVQKGVIEVNDSNLRDFYQRNSESLFTTTDKIKTSKIMLTYVKKDGNIDEKLKSEMYNTVLKAKERIDSGEDFNKVAADTNLEKKALEHVFDQSTHRTDVRIYNNVLQHLEALKTGQTTEIIQDNGAYWILKVASRGEGEIKTFDEAKDYIRTKYIDKKYDELISNLIKKANIEF